MKKFFALVLSAAMLLSLFVTASMAVTTGDGSITIENTAKDKTYTVYKVFDLTYSGDAVTYTLDAKENDALFAALTTGDPTIPFTVTKTSTENIYEVSSTESATKISEWLKDNISALGTGKEKSGTDGAVEFDKLPYGYYYITSTLGSVVTITNVKPNATVIDKNQSPTWDNKIDPDDPTSHSKGKVMLNADGSKVTENSVSIGETVDFSIAVNATAYDGDALVTYYYITDTLSDGFGKASGIAVSVDGVKLDSTDYSVRKSGDGHSFQVTVPFGEKYGAKAVIEVTYSATLEDDAIIAGAGNPNTANFTYETFRIDPDIPVVPFDPKDPTDPDYPDDPYDHTEDPDNPPEYFPGIVDNPPYDPANEVKTTTYTYAIGIYKIDGVTGAALKGAGFTVAYKGFGNTSAVQDVAEDGTLVPGVYTVCKDGADGAVTTFMVDDNGQLTIKGLSEGPYIVTETVCPAGYNAINPITANVSKDTATATKITNSLTAVDVTYDVQVYGMEIKNNTGAELPTTGGIGTTIFYAAGAILVLGAGVLMITKKRMA